MTDQGFRHDRRSLWTDRRRPPATAYRALLAVSEAIVSHRDLSALFHELAGRLHQVVRFDYLGLFLHEAASNTLRLHVLEPAEPTASPCKPSA